MNNTIDICQNKRYNLVIVAIFKNEQDNILEWIEHYLHEGVEHFYLIDNGSTDQYHELIRPYLDLIDLVIDAGRHQQANHYNKYYLHKVINQAQWVMIVDFDEFVYSQLSYATIVDYLRTLKPEIGQIHIPWKMYGSSGHIEKTEGCVRHFIRRSNYQNDRVGAGMVGNNWILTKAITRTSFLREMDIHRCYMNSSQPIEIRSDGKIVDNGSYCVAINEQILQKSALHCNHYPIQSFEWFLAIKMSRGSAALERNDRVRTTDYYNRYDQNSNEIIDDQLCRKHGQSPIILSTTKLFEAYYGNLEYFDVTNIITEHFYCQLTQQIKIDEDIIFQKYFGDPAPNKNKFLILKIDCVLKVWSELNHGNIIITPINL